VNRTDAVATTGGKATVETGPPTATPTHDVVLGTTTRNKGKTMPTDPDPTVDDYRAIARDLLAECAALPDVLAEIAVAQVLVKMFAAGQHSGIDGYHQRLQAALQQRQEGA
jgi:hypothetical protein